MTPCTLSKMADSMELVIRAAWAEMRLMYDWRSSTSVSRVRPKTGSMRFVQDRKPVRLVTILVIDSFGSWYLP